MSITVFTMTHKKFQPPPDPLYCPLQVGSALNPNLGYLRDDTGENISDQNCYYSELTGLYWIWKNVKNMDYVGTSHYRRYLINEQGYVFTRREYEELLKQYDLITTRKVLLNNSYHYGFAANHNIVALDVTGEVIREIYPGYYDTFIRLVNGPRTYFGNIFVTSKQHFDAYCEWLFTIFAQVQKRIDMDTDQDAYHRRVFGFISEFLLYVWVSVQGLSVYECKVGMLGEKAETGEIKEQLARYLKNHEIAEAKEYFLTQHKLRPDILMEASDITGELHLAMQIIATADEEEKRGEECILDREDDFARLVEMFAALNRAVTNFSMGRETAADKEAAGGSLVSPTAIEIAVAILPNCRMDRTELLARMMEGREK